MTYWTKRFNHNTVVYGPRQQLAQICPCKDCKERYPACHATCDKYSAWRHRYDKDKAEAEAEAAKERLLNEFNADNIRKAPNRFSKDAQKRKERKRG